MDEQLATRMLEVVAAIPAGSVATYGDVATMAGSTSPRLAGWVLSNLSDDETPWHRVLPASGRPAPHLAARQLRLLAAEGILAIDGRVSMTRYRMSRS